MMNKRSRLLFIFLAIGAVLLGAVLAWAMNGKSPKSHLPKAANDMPVVEDIKKQDFKPNPQTQKTAVKKPVQKEPVEINDFEETYYAPMTYANLSKLYLIMNAVNMDDISIVDGYMRINECELFSEFADNEIDWAQVRVAAKRSLDESKLKFPVRLSYVQPIVIGKYDVEKGRFAVEKDSAVWGMRRFEARAIDKTRGLCGLKPGLTVPGFQPRFIFDLGHPFVLTNISVPIEDAHKQVDDWGDAPRYAYLVMKLRFITLKDNPYELAKGVYLPHFIAVLERYDIYTNAALTKKLHGAVVRKGVKKEKPKH